MATYVNNLRLKEITTGDEDGTWGNSTNTNLELIADALGFNTQAAFSSDADLLHEVNKIKNKKIKLFFSQKPTCPKSQINKYKSRSNFPSFLLK